MPDYQNGKIYTIRSHQTDDIYIGSTIQPLSVRFGGHKRAYKSYKDGKYQYVPSFKILEHEDAYIELLENYPCNDKNELTRREGELIRQTDCINKDVLKKTEEERKQRRKEQIQRYRRGHKQQIAEQRKQYKEKNKQKILEQRNQKNTCQCGGKYTSTNKSRHIKTKQHIKYIENIQNNPTEG